MTLGRVMSKIFFVTVLFFITVPSWAAFNSAVQEKCLQELLNSIDVKMDVTPLTGELEPLHILGTHQEEKVDLADHEVQGSLAFAKFVTDIYGWKYVFANEFLGISTPVYDGIVLSEDGIPLWNASLKSKNHHLDINPLSAYALLGKSLRYANKKRNNSLFPKKMDYTSKYSANRLQNEFHLRADQWLRSFERVFAYQRPGTKKGLYTELRSKILILDFLKTQRSYPVESIKKMSNELMKEYLKVDSDFRLYLIFQGQVFEFYFDVTLDKHKIKAYEKRDGKYILLEEFEAVSGPVALNPLSEKEVASESIKGMKDINAYVKESSLSPHEYLGISNEKIGGFGVRYKDGFYEFKHDDSYEISGSRRPVAKWNKSIYHQKSLFLGRSSFTKKTNADVGVTLDEEKEVQENFLYTSLVSKTYVDKEDFYEVYSALAGMTNNLVESRRLSFWLGASDVVVSSGVSGRAAREITTYWEREVTQLHILGHYGLNPRASFYRKYHLNVHLKLNTTDSKEQSFQLENLLANLDWNLMIKYLSSEGVSSVSLLSYEVGVRLHIKGAFLKIDIYSMNEDAVYELTNSMEIPIP